MRKLSMFVMMMAVAVTFGWSSSLFAMANAQEGQSHDEMTKQGASTEAVEAAKYVCPMHADVQSDKPGECPKCGMTLKQVVQEEMSGADSHKGHSHKH
jgi:protein-arginine kinase activator protein McsA